MLCNLKELKPNPFRNFKIDPVDDEAVEKLRQSIKEDGFWGGMVCRKNKNGIEIVAGEHRRQAALKAGVTEADLFVVKDMDDESAIRVYARENATQRGNSGTAQAGSVAGAIQYLAKLLLSQDKDSPEFRRVWPTKHSAEQALESLASKGGIGEPPITHFLEKIPEIDKNIVGRHLAALKSSGDYAEIIDQIKQEIEVANKEAIKELERLERERVAAEKEAAEAETEEEIKAAEDRKAEIEEEAAELEDVRSAVETVRAASDKANDVPITFNFEGVAKHLKNPSHVETFRKAVTAKGIQPYLPVSQQARLASALVKKAKEKKVELTSGFISDNIGTMVHAIVVEARKVEREEAAELERKNWDSMMRSLQHKFARSAGNMLKEAMNLARHDKDRPKGVTLYMLPEFKESLKRAREALKIIETKLKA